MPSPLLKLNPGRSTSPSPTRAIDADARIIAAAPDLLGSLEYAIKQVPELATVPGIAAALAKAKGETE